MTSRLAHLVTAALFFTLAMGGCAGDVSEQPLSQNEEAQAAFDAGNELWTRTGATWVQQDSALLELEHAIELDPEFVMAYVFVANGNAWIHQNRDRSSERAARSLEAAELAIELAPGLPETHSALATYYYRVAKDYDQALEHYGAAQELAPDNPGGIRMTSYVARRAGRWDDAVALQLEANEIEATPAGLTELAITYRNMGRFDEAEAALRQALEINPDRTATQSGLAWLPFYQSGDLEAVRAFLDERPSGYVSNRWWVAMIDGDYQGALSALDADGADPLSGQYGIMPRSMLRGLSYAKLGQTGESLAAYLEAVETMQAMVADRPDDPRTHLALGLSLAGVGRAQEGIEAGLAGLALMPLERDAMIAPHSMGWLAEIYAMAGEPDLALEQLRALCDLPSTWTPATIAVNPWLDGLRDHEGFQALVAGT